MKIRFILPLLAAFNSLQVFADNTALVPVPRDFPTNWMSRHEAYVTEAKQGGIDLLFLGDSITDGWRWGNGGSKIWAQLYAPRHAANTRTTAGRAIIAGISNLVRQFQVRLPQTKILLLGIFPRGEKTDPVREQLQAVNAGIARLADGSKVKFLDLNEKFLAPDGTLPRDLFPDLLHPNAKGYQIWADAIEPTLSEMLK